MQLKEKISVLIGSTDKYDFLWDEFNYAFFKHFFPKIDVFFLTEKRKNTGIKTINVGNVSWYEGVSQSLLYFIKTKYVLWLQDDYFLIKNFTEKELENDLKYIEKFNIDRLGLCPVSHHYTMGEGNGGYIQMHPESKYLISLQPSIWKTDFFYGQLKKGESPWSFEINGTERILNKGYKISIRPLQWYIEVVTQGRYNKHYPNAKRILRL
jgi:hypothetical protein